MHDLSRKRPRDLNQLAASIVDEATTDAPKPEDTRDPLAVELGRRGGLKGGKARAAKVSPGERSAMLGGLLRRGGGRSK